MTNRFEVTAGVQVGVALLIACLLLNVVFFGICHLKTEVRATRSL